MSGGLQGIEGERQESQFLNPLPLISGASSAISKQWQVGQRKVQVLQPMHFSWILSQKGDSMRVSNFFSIPFDREAMAGEDSIFLDVFFSTSSARAKSCEEASLKYLFCQDPFTLFREHFDEIGISEIDEEEIRPLSNKWTSAGRGAETGGKGSVAGHSDDRRRLSLIFEIDIRIFLSAIDLFDEGDGLDIAGPRSENNPLPLDLLCRGDLILLPNLLVTEHDFGLGEEDFLQGFLRVQEAEIDFVRVIDLFIDRDPFRQLNRRIEVIHGRSGFEGKVQNLFYRVSTSFDEFLFVLCFKGR